ncbi:MAG: 2-oxo acid dehydrogenase subunit E2 [Chloroflexi bacterium]|nr:2-oxo acid dehydrogenase subunit E2 [Chloroflexota bacterium]MBI3339678.1 2-oxo acid dehydrogenase subunit E2 [Chloroflexota bacterium]
MATSVIMPALEMTQESGRLVAWLKREGESVTKGEPIMEIETDKVTIEIEAPATGILGGVLVKENDVVPVGQTIAWILAPGEKAPAPSPLDSHSGRASTVTARGDGKQNTAQALEVSPLARNIADEHGIDLALVKSNGNRIEKADVLAYINSHQTAPQPASVSSSVSSPIRLAPASPKARQLAREQGIDLLTVTGSGPDGAVLSSDVMKVKEVTATTSIETPGTVWRVMAERMTASWTTVPHFYLIREVDASDLIEWRTRIAAKVEKQSGIKPTYTDLLIKLIGFTLREHPRVNASWVNRNIQFNNDVNVGIAAAIEDGLIVPVIRHADSSSIGEIAVQRKDLIERAQNRKLRPADISDGTFTLSNLGMYNVDAFNAIVNAPQAAILAVGRIVERVVAVHGAPAVRSMMTVSLSCDHRVVDGARAAQFLDDLANLIEEPLGLLS